MLTSSLLCNSQLRKLGTKMCFLLKEDCKYKLICSSSLKVFINMHVAAVVGVVRCVHFKSCHFYI